MSATRKPGLHLWEGSAAPTPGPMLPDDRFDGLFSSPWPDPEKGTLLDHGPVSPWMRLIGDSCRGGTYTFQAPMEGHSGPTVQVDGSSFLLLSSYDYLGLLGHPGIEKAAAEAVNRYGTGTGGVRLLTGTNALHRELEGSLAEIKETESAVVFTSGYLANLAAITALFGPRDTVVLDDLCHRSLIDGCRLARARVKRFRHNDPDHLKAVLKANPEGRRLVVVEGIYSMDGDICPLPDIVEAKNRYGAFLMVDEAHSLGVLGKEGRGAQEEFGLPSDEVDIWMGSLSKAIPSVGGFLAGRKDLIAFLQHGAAPFMFSAALCPSAAAAALAALSIMVRESDRRSRLRQNERILRDGLRRIGLDTGRSASPVIPVILGGTQTALRAGRSLWVSKVCASPVIPPAVPKGQARLRLCATASMESAHLEKALLAFSALAGQEREIPQQEPLRAAASQ